MLGDQLIVQNVNAALKVVIRLENCLFGIVLRQRLVFLPVEVASVALAVHICELKQALLARDVVCHRVDDSDLWIAVAHSRSWLQPGLGSRQSLKEVGPECTAIDLAHLFEARTEVLHLPLPLGREQFRGQRLLNQLIPLGIPRLVIAEFSLFNGDWGWWSGLGLGRGLRAGCGLL